MHALHGFEVVAQADDIHPHEDVDFHSRTHRGDCHELLKCGQCGKYTLTKYYYLRWGEDLFPVRTILYPASHAVPLGLPAAVEREYKDALSVRTVALQPYVMMLRRVVEAVCTNKSPQGANIIHKLENLAEAHGIPSGVACVIESLMSLDLRREMPFFEPEFETTQLGGAVRILLDYLYSPEHFEVTLHRRPWPND